MIYDDAGMAIDNDIQGLLEHFQYDCSDYSGDPRDMEDTCQAIQVLLANPRMMGGSWPGRPGDGLCRRRPRRPA